MVAVRHSHGDFAALRCVVSFRDSSCLWGTALSTKWAREIAW